MSLDSKHNEMDDFMTLPDNLKELKTKKKQIQKLKGCGSKDKFK